jgi:hypothetical protein
MSTVTHFHEGEKNLVIPLVTGIQYVLSSQNGCKSMVARCVGRYVSGFRLSPE